MVGTMSDHKRCTLCKRPKPVDMFYERIVNGKRWPRTRCKACDNTLRGKRRTSPVAYTRKQAKYKAKLRRWRRLGINRDFLIMKDARDEDRKRGLLFDLTRDFVRDSISRGCVYCGATPSDMKISLDRIDNTKGHVRDNVVPACIRCNWTRRDMPYKAWLKVVGGMRAARKLGLFGNWAAGGTFFGNHGPHGRKEEAPVS